MAAGRPCIVQDTGFARRVPCGAGLHSWRSPEEVTEAHVRVTRDYERQARAARAIALEFFEARVLLPPLLEAAGL
ncbi:MAG: hypothetical protein AUG03_02255 [Acidobacteria bacterium 13_1_20CM_2_68_14]|nr:MAG: hypothetical protein AUG03_02255 [Acidobacteria bacterium 13_1_20CM_2_68_14]